MMKRLLIMLVLGMGIAAQAKMNILVLTVDDMNCDSVGAFGCTTPDTTPKMDRFADDAFRFGYLVQSNPDNDGNNRS